MRWSPLSFDRINVVMLSLTVFISSVGYRLLFLTVGLHSHMVLDYDLSILHRKTLCVHNQIGD